MLALARKYRSKNFQELIGQTHVVKALDHALTQGRLHHAYLLTGTRGVGKTTIARILAKSLNCETGITATPCGVCSVCTAVDQGRFVDLIELDAASNTGIDSMREVLDNAHYAPSIGRYKVYLIDEVHMLSKSAFNSMLKTLEEPPEHVKFVLATTDPQKIPITVLSRCLQFNLKPLPVAQIDAHLQAILTQESVSFDKNATALIAGAAEGSMRDALSITDQAIAHEAGHLSEAGVRAMLGVVDREKVLRLLSALSAADAQQVMADALQMKALGLDFDSVLQELGQLLHQVALVQNLKPLPAALAQDMSFLPQLEALAEALSPEQVQVLYQIAAQSRQDLALAPDTYTGFSMALLRLLVFVPKGKLEAAPAQQSMPFKSVRHSVLNVPLPAVEPAKNSVDFDGNWVALIKKMPLVALVRELARQCVLERFEGTQFFLHLANDNAHLCSQESKLTASLSAFFGRNIRLTITIINEHSDTPLASAAAQDRQARSLRDQRAIDGFENDPFVRTLIQETGGRIFHHTIQSGEPDVQ